MATALTRNFSQVTRRTTRKRKNPHKSGQQKKAIGFYTKFGGSVVGEKVEPFGQQQIPMTELIIKFDNLKKILKDNMER